MLFVFARVGLCGSAEIPASIQVWPDTVDQFQHRGLDFKRSLRHALRDGDSGVRDFIADSRFTDAAGGLGFGVTLLDLAQHIGDDRFSRIAASLESKEKAKVWLLLRAGAEYRRQLISEAEVARRLPKTCEILTKT